MEKQVKITGKKRYPSNYEVMWENVNDSEDRGVITVSTDELIDGDYHDEDVYGEDDSYISEGFSQYALDSAKEDIESFGYEVVEVSEWNF